MSHGAVLTRLVYHLESLADWPFPPYEARGMAVNVLGRTVGGRWEVRLLNDDGYLRERGLNKGRRHRRHRYRVIAWRGGELARRFLPGFAHPLVQPLLHRITRRDRVLALEPTANLPSDWHVPLTELRDPAAT
jgi:hypothetical protein